MKQPKPLQFLLVSSTAGHVPPHPFWPVHSLCVSLPAAAFTHLPSAPALLQTWQVLLPPRQALSQQTLSTQWFDPQSESFVHVAPFGLRPAVHSRSAVQKFGASHFVVAFE